LAILLFLDYQKHKWYMIGGAFLCLYLFQITSSNTFQTFWNETWLGQNDYPFKATFLWVPALFLLAIHQIRGFHWARDAWQIYLGIALFLTFTVVLPGIEALWPGRLDATFWLHANLSLGAYVWLSYTFSLVLLARWAYPKRMEKGSKIPQTTTGLLRGWLTYFTLMCLGLGFSYGYSYHIQADWVLPLFQGCQVGFLIWVVRSGYMQLPIFQIWTVPPKPQATTLPLDPVFQQIEQRMQEEAWYAEPNLSLKDLAKRLGLSQRAVSEHIHRATGKHVKEYINEFRVKAAQRALQEAKNAHLNIEQIGWEVGFNSKASFYAVFKRITGTTPARFKKEVDPEVFLEY
ncbi:MAG: AraC family transcriptional regulator, partial [Bacteroidota bacterium]